MKVISPSLTWLVSTILIAFVTSSAVAQGKAEGDDIKRDEFLRLEKVIWSMSDEEVQQGLQALGDYPLVPYLRARELLHGLHSDKAPQITEFLDEYEGTALERRVRLPWLRYLAKKNSKTLFMQFYRPMGDTALQCQFLQYELAANREHQLLYPQIAELWTVGKSQPKVCDPVFKVWIKAGQLSEDLVLHRIQKAAMGGQHTLIPYLKTLLPADQVYLADLWHQVRRDPSAVRYLARFSGKYPAIEAQIMSYGLSRLIWRDQRLALTTYAKADNKLVFNQAQRAAIVNKFAISLALEHHKDAQTWLLKALDVKKNPEVMRWHLAYLLKDQDWASIINLITKSAPELTKANQYQYWLARAYEQTGNQSKADTLYVQLAAQRNYYGFLSSARLGQAFSLQNSPVQVSSAQIAEVKALPSAQRAFELLQLARYHEARIEWRYTQNQLNEQQKLVAAVISSEWGWHDQAIFAFSDVGYLDDVNRRFPVAYEDIITREARRNNIEPEWAFAIARRESSFMTDAVSPANARGLMQLLPSTAKYLEKRRVSKIQLLNPKVNAKLGNKYLRYLLNKLDNNALLATASYNAGWRRVKQWLPEEQALAADIWVETIPYKETRNYVKAVMAYQQIYQAKLHAPASLAADAVPTNTQQALAGQTVHLASASASATRALESSAVVLNNSVFGELVSMSIPVSL